MRIQGCSDDAVELSKCSIQWFRLSSECSRREPIVGADKASYAPEPIDVGRVLEVDILFNGQKVYVITAGPINPASGLENYVDTLSRKANFEFSVFVSQMNGKTRLKLSKGWITKDRDSYSGSTQLCGFRGGGIQLQRHCIGNQGKDNPLFWFLSLRK